MWVIKLLLNFSFFTGYLDKENRTARHLEARWEYSEGAVISLWWCSNSQRRPSQRCRHWRRWTSASWSHVKPRLVRLSSGGSPTPACLCQVARRCKNQHTVHIVCCWTWEYSLTINLTTEVTDIKQTDTNIKHSTYRYSTILKQFTSHFRSI